MIPVYKPRGRPRDWPQVVPTRPPGSKTVLFLGAGASVPEGIPTQARLLSAVDRYGTGPAGSEVSADWQLAKRYISRLHRNASLECIALEDTLTSLDKAMSGTEVVAGAGLKTSYEPRRALVHCVASLLNAIQMGNGDYFENAADKLASATGSSPMKRLGLLLRRLASETPDRLVVISTNWDTTLDFATTLTDRNPVTDYCSYTTPWEQHYRSGPGDDEIEDLPSIWKRPLGLPTAKILKLHGSLNWLYCPTCNRLFSSPRVNIGLLATVEGEARKRRFCAPCYSAARGPDRAPLLREMIVTPTMMKRLDLVPLKMIWYNAAVELSEATEVIFAGYSAPPADFEIRYLLSKGLGVRGTPPRVRIFSRCAGDIPDTYRGLLGSAQPASVEGGGIAALVDELEKKFA